MFDRKLSAAKARLVAWAEWVCPPGDAPAGFHGELLEVMAVFLAAHAAVSPGSGDWPRQAWGFAALTAFLGCRAVYLRQVERERAADSVRAAARRPDAPFSEN